MSDDFKYPRGSEWRRWDLHTHTPLDPEWTNRPSLATAEEKESFAKQYIRCAKDKGLSVAAITDHNFCNDVNDLLIPAIQKEAQDNGIIILPGFELTTTDCGGVHVLAIFPDSTDLELIHNIVTQMFPANVVRVPSDGPIPFSNKSLSEVRDIISEADTEVILVFAHADRENGVLHERGGQNRVRLWQEPFMQIAQVSKSPSEFDGGSFCAKVFSGQDENYKKDMAYVAASDCRTINPEDVREGLNCLGDKFTWIKADPDFEGLKQIIYEPQDRVCIQQEKPQEKTGYLIIDSVRFCRDSGTGNFADEWIPLNPNLTVIIGGKSSGKSLLLYHVAKTVAPSEVEGKSYILGEEPYKFDFSFDFEVRWGDGEVNSLYQTSDEKKRQLTYIPQTYINRLAEEKKGKQHINRLILNILSQNEFFQEFHSAKRAEIKKKNTHIKNTIVKLFSLRDDMESKVDELKQQGDKDAVIKEVASIKAEIEDLIGKSGLSKEENTKYDTLSKKKLKLEGQLKANNQNINYGEDLKEFVIDLKNSFLMSVKDKRDEMQATSDTGTEGVKLLLGASDQIASEVESSLNEIMDRNFKFIDTLVSKAEQLKGKLSGIQGEMKPYMERVANQSKLKALQEKLAQQADLVRQIEENEKEINRLKGNISRTENEIFAAYADIHNLYNDVVMELQKAEYKVVSHDIELQVNLLFNREEFTDRFLSMLDLRVRLDTVVGGFNQENQYVYERDNHVQNIQAIFGKLCDGEEEEVRLRVGRKYEDAVKNLFDDYFHLEFDLLQNNEYLEFMSPGKRGLVLLQMFIHLSNAKYPILIDQPEDNLDNRTIFKELTEFVRNKKIQRQIFVVTHNANLVVSADAEEVIVANQSGQQPSRDNRQFRFEYISGALECSFDDREAQGVLFQKGIKQHTCEILEGGEDAFKKRERKYGIK